MKIIELPNGSFFNVKEFKALKVLPFEIAFVDGSEIKDRVIIDFGNKSHLIYFESPEEATEFADSIKSEVETLDVESDELYRIAVRDKLKIQLLEKNSDIENEIVSDLVEQKRYLKHLISEANNTFYIGKPKIEVPKNY